jgi:hypothetical protein
MGKGSSILGIIAILLGAGGLGFGFITWNTQNSMQANLTTHDIWFQYDEDTFTVNPAYAYLHIPNMSIVIDLTTPASFHILFTCSAVVYPEPAEFAGISFFFSVDGVRLLEPHMDVGPYEGTSTIEYSSVALQHFLPGVSPGTYNISVMVYSAETINFIRLCSLKVQSL